MYQTPPPGSHNEHNELSDPNAQAITNFIVFCMITYGLIMGLIQCL